MACRRPRARTHRMPHAAGLLQGLPRRDRCGRRRRGTRRSTRRTTSLRAKRTGMRPRRGWSVRSASPTRSALRWRRRGGRQACVSRCALATSTRRCARSAKRARHRRRRDPRRFRMVRRGRQSALVDRVEDRPAREPQDARRALIASMHSGDGICLLLPSIAAEAYRTSLRRAGVARNSHVHARTFWWWSISPQMATDGIL
jgi:hypothetical protein